MKKRILVAAMAVVSLQLIGCASSQKSADVGSGANIDPAANSVTAIANQRIAINDYKKDGVKIIYTLGGNVEAIEVTGYAPTWGGSHNAAREAFRAAEMEAKKSLSDFLYKESVTSTTSIVMISTNLEHAKDQITNKFATNKAGQQEPGTEGNTGTADDLVAVDDDAKKKIADGTVDSKENTAERNDALKIASRMKTTINVSNRGILSGLYLKEGSSIDDGKAVKVVMRWDKKNNAGRIEIGRLMAM